MEQLVICIDSFYRILELLYMFSQYSSVGRASARQAEDSGSNPVTDTYFSAHISFLNIYKSSNMR